MKRFESAQVGDEVYCRLRGNGIIKSTTYSERYPIECLFYDHCTSFDYDGRSQKDHFEPTLFYRKRDEKYITERPEPEIDWSKVPMGTKVFTYLKKEDINDPYWNKDEDIEMLMGYFPNLERPFWSFDDYDRETASGYKYCKLAEPCKIEWIKNND